MKLTLLYRVKTWMEIQNCLPNTEKGNKTWLKIENRIFCKPPNLEVSIPFSDKEILMVEKIVKDLALEFSSPGT